jgi:predicted PurR-regulated permease PerM
MTTSSGKYPFYIKSTVILFGIMLFVYALFTLREILVPVAFALLFSILLNPILNWLVRRKVPRVWSISITVVVGILIVSAIFYFVGSQIAGFSDELPALKKKFAALTEQVKQMASDHFGVTDKKQDQVVKDVQEKLQPIVGRTLGTLAGTLGVMLLVPVYIFLFLFYKPLLLNFIYEVFEEKSSKDVKVILEETKGAIQNYMVGLLLEALIVAVLNTTALLIIGVKYAVLLGVMGALLNMLPYIGGVVSTLLPVIMVMITKNGIEGPLAVVGAYLVIQFIDNHFIMPYIVSSKVKINALISIIIVLMGGMLWGVPGMFLSIPFVGVLKIIFDRIPELQPWGKLLGDEVPTRHKGLQFNFRKTKATAS